MLRRAGERAGVGGIGLYRGRHAYAIRYIRSGGDMHLLPGSLGRSSLARVRGFVAVVQVDVEPEA